MWLGFWKLTSDPFLGPARRYVSTPGHDEAVARLAATIESAQRLALVRGAEGLGKSMVVAKALSEIRGAGRRVSRVARPGDGLELFSGLAEGLGARAPAGSTRSSAWGLLCDAIRVCHWQKAHPILVVDGVGDLSSEADRRDLERLAHLGDRSSGPLTIVLTVCDNEGHDDDVQPPSAWQLITRLAPLTRSETGGYVEAKLAAANREGPTFTPRALSRLYDLTMGVPRGVDRLASLSLMAGALLRVERVTPEVVDGASRECQLPRDGFAA